MELIKLRQKSQITIPNKVREKLGLSPGDYLDIKVKDNKITLIPKIKSSKESVLSSEGKRRIKESLEDLKKGNVTIYKNIDDMINNLSS
ncbi:MAG: AbrB/MazE/SpoVT family DNA-binding domain-containing protein [Candidatus Paceibacterota bacterium]